jgi:hypothetical protein
MDCKIHHLDGKTYPELFLTGTINDLVVTIDLYS